jgi:hypothetical protein
MSFLFWVVLSVLLRFMVYDYPSGNHNGQSKNLQDIKHNLLIVQNIL